MNKDSPFLYQGGIFRQRRGDGAGAGAPAYPRFVGALLHAPGVCAGLVAPAATDARGAAPREQVVSLGSSLPEVGAGGPHTPMRGRSAPPPRVTFPSRGKSPKARQGLRPWTCRCGVTALFALAALRSGSRRAAFCHRKRPICHFEVVGESVLFFSLVLRRKDFVLLIRGAGGWVARLGATLGLNGV